jgi:transcriptional regulator GlxA family with amidase domain
MSCRISFLLFPGFQILDAAGPLAAFEQASYRVRGAYQVRFVAAEAGDVVSSAGVAWRAEGPRALRGTHTLMVVGGNGAGCALEDERLIGLLRRSAARAPRVTSVCSGALLLAKAGLLEGKRATTHWSRVPEMRQRFPDVRVEPDSIWVRDGKFWTSAGITAGIDLALALITEDLGENVARDVARELVVYVQRPGGQTQFSNLLALGNPAGRFAGLHLWVQENLAQPLPVERLAKQAKMSPRSFARAYLLETGVTPAKTVERLRLEAARAALDTGGLSVLQIAEQVGFGDPERMRRAFLRHFGAPPIALKRRGPPGRGSLATNGSAPEQPRI